MIATHELSPIEVLAQDLRALASLFRENARIFVRDADMWSALAEIEDEHASWVDSFPDFIEAGVATQSIRCPARERLLALGRRARAEGARAAKNVSCPAHALRIALELETDFAASWMDLCVRAQNPIIEDMLNTMRNECEVIVSELRSAANSLASDAQLLACA